jgi:hypothetical protein
MGKTAGKVVLQSVAQATGGDYDYVKQVSCGKRHDETTEWAIGRLPQLSESLKKQLMQEYQEKFGTSEQAGR